MKQKKINAAFELQRFKLEAYPFLCFELLFYCAFLLSEHP